ncbi:hypothetical protein [Streptomyces sp. MST-110588]|uniref:hypothetical protein n=1 Tax=Streptomyces sp. MST-110588 TaxID=2833628 RepID=UPI001F5CC569|nr:hypothetical protein [Streptomyces sp. MST-110588]
MATVLALCCVVALTLLTLTACRRSGGAPAPSSSGGTATPGTAPVFLAPGTCSTRGRSVFHEVSCRSERAVARVLARYDGSPAQGPGCPDRTDFVLHISPYRPDPRVKGDFAVPRGYACMRNLLPPHPGDPGGGGGPRTVVGDCVYTSGRGQVKETACDGSGERAPQFEVTATVRTRPDCPSSTALYVQLGGEAPVGCARRLQP